MYFLHFWSDFMLFSSLTFLFLFLPLVIFSYYLVNRKLKNYVLLLFSLFFYAYGGPKFLIYLVVSVFFNYIFGLLMSQYKEEFFKAKIILFLTLCVNLSILGYFKYGKFILQNINLLFNTNFQSGNIIMPIGISFYTFHSLSYIIDIHRGHAKVLKNPFTLLLYISFFPQLVAGPIVRYETVATQFYNREENVGKFIKGIQRFIIGLAKKLLVANSMGLIADQIFNMNVSTLSVLTSWIGAIAYTLQIYFDFSGYSDMAIGLASMFGFTFLENFNYPYISTSITEFWRRWHISLGTWFRDYVYIPLGGNRVGTFKFFRNIFVVWFLTGLWHGANWTFISWGLYYGILLILEKYILKVYIQKLWKPVQHLYTIFFVIVGWVLFRSPNFDYAFKYIKNMFAIGATTIVSNEAIFYITEYKFEFLIAFIFSMPVGLMIVRLINTLRSKKLTYFFIDFVKPIIDIALFIVSIIYLVNSTFNPFIYFKF
nr:MBOAT family O-acyltransferase [Clostridium kluyveri]